MSKVYTSPDQPPRSELVKANGRLEEQTEKESSR